jgi:L,D-transpeptidase YcbB
MWKEGERVKHFATIVGDNDLSVNPLTNEEEHSNRTPTPMAAYIDRVIFNPYWNVTQRIRAVRILPQVKESIERKYAVQFAQMLEERESSAAEQPTRSGPSLAMLGRGRGGGSVASVQEEDESADDASDSEISDSEISDGEVDSDGEELVVPEPEPQLTEEELAELEEQERQERRERAFQEWTHTQRVYNEESERHEQRRFFHTSKLRQIEAGVDSDDPEALENLHAQFPYLDWETGEVDVESTDRNNIPSWYERNGYEVVHPGHAVWEYVRMLPGPENSLGDVKIIFPNYDNIYLHDTPARNLFSSTIRGYSHGCIRLERPLQLSEALLTLDGQDVNIQRILDDEDYYPIFLNRQVPVFLEYYTVTVDDEGRANFLADIYDYDDEELERLIQ